MRISFTSSYKYKILLLSLLTWLIAFISFQYIDPFITISKCSFPKINDDTKTNPNIQLSKILLIADPQLIDNHTYPKRPSSLLKLSKLTTDNYLYKNYISILNNLKPESIIFLGDLLDNGRESTDQYYLEEYKRFYKLFLHPASQRKIQLLTNVPGNHDVGFADGVTKHSLQRFGEHFGDPNKVIHTLNHDLILFDDVTLTNNEDKSLSESSLKFLDELNDRKLEKTRLVFDHIALWRDPNKYTCGRLRESSKSFPIARGYQFQTVVDEENSLKILKSLKPDVIFSGDDHDYCEIVQSYVDFNGKEHKTINVNVKSMSMAMGIHRPAVQLLTLYSEPVKLKEDWKINDQIVKKMGENLDFSYDICYLTNPYVDIISYIMLAITNGILLLIISSERKKRYVSITEHRVYENKILQFFKSINWLKFVKIATLNGILVIFMYYLLSYS